jgi:hypothetical protein
MLLLNLATAKFIFTLMVIALVVIPIWASVWAFGKKKPNK